MRRLAQDVPQLAAAIDCVGEDVTFDQVARAIARYLQEHPTKLPQPDVIVLSKVLHHAFPCRGHAGLK
jgi:hypothetical protein